jgi:hypothetical protein
MAEMVKVMKGSRVMAMALLLASITGSISSKN